MQRLHHKYTTELTNSISENCTIKVHLSFGLTCGICILDVWKIELVPSSVRSITWTKERDMSWEEKYRRVWEGRDWWLDTLFHYWTHQLPLGGVLTSGNIKYVLVFEYNIYSNSSWTRGWYRKITKLLHYILTSNFKYPLNHIT